MLLSVEPTEIVDRGSDNAKKQEHRKNYCIPHSTNLNNYFERKKNVLKTSISIAIYIIFLLHLSLVLT